MRTALPAIIIVLLVGTFMFKPLIEGDKTAGFILLGAVVLSGLVTLIGGISRGRRRFQQYRQSRYTRNGRRW